MRLTKRSSWFALAGLILVPTIHVAGSCSPDDREPPPSLSVPHDPDTGQTRSSKSGANPPPDRTDPEYLKTREFEIKIQLGETIGDYVSWTQIPVARWFEMLGVRSARHLQAGRTHRVQLSLQQFTSIQTQRSARKARLREQFYARYRVIGERMHVVRSGESSSLIAARSKIPLWLLVEANEEKDIAILYPGMKITVPTIGKGEARPPAPTAPAPTHESTPEVSLPPKVLAPPPTWVDPISLPEQDPVLTITLKEGESIGLLAKLAEIPASRIIEANHLPNPDQVGLGAPLKLPLPAHRWASFLHKRQSRELLREATRAYRRRGFQIRTIKIKAGDTARGIALTNGGELAALNLLNPGIDLDRLQPGDQIRIAVHTDHSGMN